MPIANSIVNFAYFNSNQYNSLTKYDTNTIYYVYDTASIYIGNVLIVSETRIKDLMYPIGKIECFFDNDDHSNYLGYSWERCLQGRVPVGIDSNDSDFNTIGSQIGEKQHTLTLEEMPAHTHTYKVVGLMGSGNDGMQNRKDVDATGTKDLQSTGGNEPHNNIQPSEVVSFWKRIA